MYLKRKPSDLEANQSKPNQHILNAEQRLSILSDPAVGRYCNVDNFSAQYSAAPAKLCPYLEFTYNVLTSCALRNSRLSHTGPKVRTPSMAASCHPFHPTRHHTYHRPSQATTSVGGPVPHPTLGDPRDVCGYCHVYSVASTACTACTAVHRFGPGSMHRACLHRSIRKHTGRAGMSFHHTVLHRTGLYYTGLHHTGLHWPDLRQSAISRVRMGVESMDRS